MRAIRHLTVLAILSASLALTACGANATPTPAGAVSSFATATDWVVGLNRFPFALIRLDGSSLDDASVTVRFYSRAAGGSEELKSSHDTVFHQVEGSTDHFHPDGFTHDHPFFRSVYVAPQAQFDVPGIWIARIEGTDANGASMTVGDLAFRVSETSATVPVGGAVPAIKNPTLRDVANVSEITSADSPEPGLYQLTVAEALEQSKPLVIAFASPAFCVSAMCGPVTEVVVEQFKTYGSQVNFIHIEPWDIEAARDKSRLEPSQATLEWGLQTEPWVFVVDAEGNVSSRFEGLVGASELAAAIAEVVE
ncbi:MAG: hypothetical protein O2812_04050 [Chloroflexi bacterium]|nr:hypothetical protein [Chloroflexota bacterium]